MNAEDEMTVDERRNYLRKMKIRYRSAARVAFSPDEDGPGAAGALAGDLWL